MGVVFMVHQSSPRPSEGGVRRHASRAVIALLTSALATQTALASAPAPFVILVDGEPVSQSVVASPVPAVAPVPAAASVAAPAASGAKRGRLRSAGDETLAGGAVRRPAVLDAEPLPVRRSGGAPVPHTRDGARRPAQPATLDPHVSAAVNADGAFEAPTALDLVRIDVTYDPAEPVRALGATARHDGDTVIFSTHANYPAFIERGELRVFCGEDARPCAVLPAAPNSRVTWRAVGEGPYSYSYRVHGRGRRHDETARLPVDAPAGGSERIALAREDIAVHGGTITVRGREVPAGHALTVLGEPVAPLGDGTFVLHRIVPPGEHDVAVKVASHEGALDFARLVNVPGSRWFYVGLADLTVRRAIGGEGFQRDDGTMERTRTTGRLAMYAKGRVKGSVLITAAADTREGDVRGLFRDLDARDTRDLLRRLDPDEYYPVYGDDSTLIEDAPTSGKFYLRVARGDSHVMWGNARTAVTGSRFLAHSRTLYGASAKLASKARTGHGEARSSATGYAAVPDTLPGRDAMRGTGGSAYFLSRGEIVRGSENLTIELRDRVGGRIIETRTLVYGEDYEIDYDEGVVLLRRPLASTAADGKLVRDGALGGHQAWLVAAYEYVPRGRERDAYAFGGRAEHWVGDKVRVGVSGNRERDGDGEGTLGAYGIDALLRHSDGTWASAEFARSRGARLGPLTSLDGGLTFAAGTPGTRRARADAVHVEGRLDLADVTDGRVEGGARAYYERVEGGFSAFSRVVDVDEEAMGAAASVKRGRLALTGSVDRIEREDGYRVTDVAGHVGVALTERDVLEFGLRLLERRGALSATGLPLTALEDGRRTDVAARLTHEFDNGNEAYVFGQATLDRRGGIERNDRGGAGGTLKLSETLGLSGELSYGEGGLGALVGVTHDPAPGHHSYLSYSLDESTLRGQEGGRDWGSDLGAVGFGTRRALGGRVTARVGNTFDLFDQAWTLTQSYGLTFRPDRYWTLGGGIEAGTIRDRTVNADGLPNEDFERRAGSLTVGYDAPEKRTIGQLRLEGRRERSEFGTRDRDTVLVSVDAGTATSQNWRLLANLDLALSSGVGIRSTDGDYVEGSLGYAYRPAENGRLDALARYTYLHDLPERAGVGVAQLDGLSPMQRSHILSLDASFRLTPRIEIGGKVGGRIAQTRLGPQDRWTRNDALLTIARADVHVIHAWDAFAEGRVLHVRTDVEDNTLLGGVVGISRHVGRNLKVGVGYNFGRFSDDLRDLTYDDQGVFLNVTGKI